MKFLQRHKWYIYWLTFTAVVVSFIIYVILHISKNDFNNALLQFGSILIPLFAAIIIMLQNNEQIERSTKTQLEYLQKLNDKEIEEMRNLFQQQINVLVENTNKQIEFLRESTSSQISTYQSGTQKIAKELSNNSVFLGELLQRELEKAILQAGTYINAWQKKVDEAKAFQLFRSEEAKEMEILQKEGYVSQWRQWQEDMRDKLTNLINQQRG